MAVFRTAFAEESGYGAAPDAMVLFTADLTGVSALRPNGDHLIIDWWHPGDSPHSTKRF